MSIALMSLVWKLPFESRTQKLVLLALADNANDQGVCWPSGKHLSEKCNLSRQAVMRQISALEKKKLLARTRNGRANEYQLFVTEYSDGYNVQKQTQLPLPPVNGDTSHLSTRVTSDVNGGYIRCKEGVTSDVNQGDTNHQEPPEEPSKEPPPQRGCGGFSEKLEAVWVQWTGYRKKFGKCKDWDSLWLKQIEWLRSFDEDTAIEILNQSMRNGWQGLFPPRGLSPPCVGINGTSIADKIILGKEYERILSETKQLESRYSEGMLEWKQRDRDRRKALVERRNELRIKLGIKM